MGFFFFFRAAPAAYGNSQARRQIRVAAAGLHHSHSYAGSELHSYSVPPCNARSLTHEWGQGSSLHPHRHYVGFLTCWATTGIPLTDFNS